jgi:phage terminase small subunit
MELEIPYPSPRKDDAVFNRHWNRLVQEMVKKKSFREAHLSELEILCDIYKKYDNLSAIIEIDGDYLEGTAQRTGERLLRPNPGIKILLGYMQLISRYSTDLGFTVPGQRKSSGRELTEDNVIPPPEDKPEWS